MRSVREFQARMRDFAFDADGRGALVGALADCGGPPMADRLSIHRNTTMLGLAGALGDGFPVVRRLVGELFFDRMAQDFLRAHPPRRASLLTIGAEFPAFLTGYAPVRELPYLSDVARLECAWTHAYHAADGEPLHPQILATLDPERLGELRLSPLPSQRLLAAAYPVDAIWRSNQEAAPDEEIRLDSGPVHLLVHRPEMAVVFHPLSRGAFSFLMALAAQQTLAAAWDSALATDPDFDLASELAGLLTARAFGGYRLP
ncbi:DNA-binding domain-containing protein [Azospirillum griseum]|uniref:DUF2063 domain-containing protein n=1 Tax=Azospirillum griseum TaxID=2496639 RepID=A0A3S0HZY3_9PROT|nr:DNA-binding domain-containing protein [Azospirillum griseum]RTR18928.1 DUF2063 domain-containing protein [Azospirillum griseum]